MNLLPGHSVPLSEAVYCADCLVVFSSREAACTKCGAVAGIGSLDSTAPAREIARLRDLIAGIEGGLIQIVHGKFSTAFKERLAAKLLNHIRKGTEPSAVNARPVQKGVR